jgi:hypothetical protein
MSNEMSPPQDNGYDLDASNNMNQYPADNSHYEQQNQDLNSNTSPQMATNDEALKMLQNRLTEMQYNRTLLDQLNLISQAAASVQRPSEQFITIATNGIILGTTETITGTSPDSLLMSPL